MEGLEKRKYYTFLFDFYGNILTEKQRLYFEEYYFNDYSLAEIAKNYEISRSAVFDQINTVHQLLDKYEDNLKLYKKFKQRLDIYREYSNQENQEINELIEKLKGIE